MSKKIEILKKGKIYRLIEYKMERKKIYKNRWKMDGKIERYLYEEFQNRKIERKRDKQRYR